MKFFSKLPHNLIISATIILTGYSLFTLVPEIKRVMKIWGQPAVMPGAHFIELKSKLNNPEIIGFLTNKDTSSEKNDGEFLRAQYTFAPIALDLNKAQTINIISATSKEALVAILEENRLKPIFINKYGKTIAVRYR